MFRGGREGLEREDVLCVAADQSRFSNGTLLPRKCTNFERTVQNFTLLIARLCFVCFFGCFCFCFVLFFS